MTDMRAEVFLDGRITLHCGDCLDVLKTLDADSVDSCVTDPPYHLTADKKGGTGIASLNVNSPAGRARISTGFMGKQWDGGDIAFRPEVWREVLRVLKPGAHLLAFGGDRTFHRLACAVEDAGFEIRGTIAWIFGQGFPKNLNVSARLKNSLPADALCACAYDCPQTVQDFQSDYLSCHDFDDEQPHADQEIAQCSFPSQDDAHARSHDGHDVDDPAEEQANIFSGAANGHHATENFSRLESPQLSMFQESGNIQCDKSSNMLHAGLTVAHKTHARKSGTLHSNGGLDVLARYANLSRCPNCGKYKIPEGLGTALKPAMELIVLARKPLSEDTVAANVLKWGTGALNIDKCRVGIREKTKVTDAKHNGHAHNVYGAPSGGGNLLPDARWPANVIHDGSEEVVAGFPETSPSPTGMITQGGDHFSIGSNEKTRGTQFQGHGDSGSAARFFYTAKADADDRLGSKHPTVKPLDLKQYLVRLVTPPGGLVLDCFAGTGTTGEAAFREGMRAVLIEREAEYQDDIRRRMQLMLASARERRHESVKTKQKDRPPDHGPLFGGAVT